MNSHLTGKRLKSSPVAEPKMGFLFFFTPNFKITHQGRKGFFSRGPLRTPACSHPPPPLSPRGRCRQRGRPLLTAGSGEGPPAPLGPGPRGAEALPARGASLRRQRDFHRARQRGPTRHPLLLACSRTFCFSSQGQRTIKGAWEPLTGSERGCWHLEVARTRFPRRASRPRGNETPGLRRVSADDAAAVLSALWARPLPAPLSPDPTPTHGRSRLSRGRFDPASLRAVRAQLHASRRAPQPRQNA